MKANEIKKLVNREPFAPFKFVMADGEEVTVNRPRKSLVSGGYVAMVGVCGRVGAARTERFRIIQVDRIVTAESGAGVM